jgi:hypothetical protein
VPSSPDIIDRILLPKMPRLVRRDPLLKRISDRLDFWDIYLQLAEWVNDDTVNEWLQAWAIQIGVGCNILFIIAKLAAKPSLRSSKDDVFGDLDSRSGPGWFGWLVCGHDTAWLCGWM